MSNPTPVIVEDALPADLPALAVIQRLAFAPSAITRHIFGSVSDTDMDANSLERMQQCRSGAGTALLKWACDQAERAGLNTYLKATEEGMSLYKRFGFVAGPPTVVKAGEEDLVMTPMRRTPAISILPATEADVPAIATLHLRAFAEDEMYAAIYKDVKPDVLQAFMEDRIRTFALRGKTAWLKAVKGDTILGHVMWSLPEKEGEEIKVGVAADEPDSATMPFPEGTDVETAEHYFAQFDEFNKTIKEACYKGLPMYTRSRFASDGEPIYSKDRSFSVCHL
ncbi:hypothetical protein RQP46_005878 [Phenoliferia psychrophenolica]